MTEEQGRMPQGVPMLAHALETGDDAGTDLFAWTPENAATPHPNFTARAAIWRDQRAGLISIAEAQRRSAAIGAAPAQPAPHAQGTLGKSRAPVARPRHERPSTGRHDIPRRGWKHPWDRKGWALCGDIIAQ